MKPTLKPRVKICCIQSVDEAWMAISHGASAIGLVSEMPSGPGVISDDLIREIAAIVPPPVSAVLLTSKQDAVSIVAQQREFRVNTIQLCDRIQSGSLQDLRVALPGIALVQVVHVTGEQTIDEALLVAPLVDGILLDSGDPSLPVKELGGTGRTHDWNISRRIRELLDVPVFLGGGLNPGNVRQAIEQVLPFGLDVCTGVRTNGKLDEGKLSEFFYNVSGIKT